MKFDYGYWSVAFAFLYSGLFATVISLDAFGGGSYFWSAFMVATSIASYSMFGFMVGIRYSGYKIDDYPFWGKL